MRIINPSEAGGTPQESGKAAAAQLVVALRELLWILERAERQIRNARMQDAIEAGSADPYQEWMHTHDHTTLAALDTAAHQMELLARGLAARQVEHAARAQKA